MKNKRNLFFLGFLCVLSVGGAALVYMATSRIGPGVSADGSVYLSVAENLLKGKGFIDLYGRTLTLAPPLYPVLIASVSWLTRADIFFVGWYINIVIFGLVIFFSGILFQKTYPDRILFAYIGSIFTATSLAVIDTCASILSDSLLLLLVVLFLLAVRSFTETQKSRDLLWMGLMACLASLERYAGMFLILSGVIFLLYFYWRNYVKGLSRFALFLISALPILLWTFFHNYLASRVMLSYSPTVSVMGNSYWTIVKVLYWFFPYRIIQIATPFGLLIAILLALFLLNRPPTWKRWFQKLVSRTAFASSILFFIYLGILIFYTDYTATDNLASERYQIVLLPLLLSVLFAAYEELIPPRLGDSVTKIKDGILIGVFILWLIYPISKLITYERQTWINGEIAYNRFNYVDINESDFLKTAGNLPTGQKIYSNYEAAAWFYLRKDILSIPRIDPKSQQFYPDSLTKFRDLIGSSGGGYLVWFKTINYRDNLPSLDQLHQTIKMEPLFTSDVGDIYRISSNAP